MSHPPAQFTRARARRRAGRTIGSGLTFVAAVLAAFVAFLIIDSGATSPIPLGQSATIGVWTVRVESASWGAGAAAGARRVKLSVVVGYRGPGESGVPLGFAVEGAHKVRYGPTICGTSETADPSFGPLGLGGPMFSGATEHGAICFEVAANDASTLRLLVAGNGPKSRVEFAVRNE